MNIEKITMWYCLLGLITMLIGMYRGLTNKQATEANELDSISWFFAWWIYLPIFIVRYVKYKLMGKNL